MVVSAELVAGCIGTCERGKRGREKKQIMVDKGCNATGVSVNDRNLDVALWDME